MNRDEALTVNMLRHSPRASISVRARQLEESFSVDPATGTTIIQQLMATQRVATQLKQSYGVFTCDITGPTVFRFRSSSVSGFSLTKVSKVMLQLSVQRMQTRVSTPYLRLPVALWSQVWMILTWGVLRRWRLRL